MLLLKLELLAGDGSGPNPEMLPEQGAAHSAEFRKFILSRNPVYPEKFKFPENPRLIKMLESWDPGVTNGMRGASLFPIKIHHWCMQSRRVYSLSEDLQQFLEIASVEKIQWQDITFPFDSFCITLPTPIEETEIEGFKGAKYDTILFSKKKVGTQTLIQLDLLPTILDRSVPLQRNGIERIEDCIRNKRFKKARTLLNEIDRTPMNVYSYGASFSVSQEQWMASAMASFSHVVRLEGSKGSEENVPKSQLLAMRTVIGLCLYLESLAGKRNKQGGDQQKWKKAEVESTPDTRAAIQEAEICDISYEQSLNDDEKKLFKLIRQKGLKRALIEMGAHFRCAHWRRRRGFGNDPSAPKAVYVRSAMVRHDRLPESGLPPGVETNVS
ncbi:MAG: hypothetical protein JWO73_684 [Candidatus Taylorbacteria bacterium]|nr:hypothetical protein [Candidatus Taylorbacteria bacterium]